MDGSLRTCVFSWRRAAANVDDVRDANKTFTGA
jgi:hypothetical protein